MAISIPPLGMRRAYAQAMPVGICSSRGAGICPGDAPTATASTTSLSEEGEAYQEEGSLRGSTRGGKTAGLPGLTGPATTPPTLRPYQHETLTALRQVIAQGYRAPLLVQPTGSGKTVVASEIIRSALERGSQCLFLAPRRELVAQASAKLDDAGVEHGVILSGADEKAGLNAAVHLAGIDTILARAVRGNRLRLPDYDLIVVDEAHLAATETRRKLLARWPDAVKLGLTATPTRKDGRALGAIFDKIVDPAPVSRLTDEGYLVPARYFSVSEPDLTGVRTTAGDYNSRDLEEAVNQPQLVGDVVEHWLRHAGGRRTVVFATSMRHSVALQDEFLRNGVAAEHVDARTPQSERDAVFERFRDGQTQVLTNCLLASYGFDLPELSCVVIARPTKSLMLFLQMVGRGFRPADGKDDCLVLDHSGCVHLHGFAHEPREWTLDGIHALAGTKRGKRDIKPFKSITCPECRAIFEAARICPECGYELTPRGKTVETIDGELVDITGEAVTKEPDPRDWYRELLAICKERGWKPAFAAHKYKERHGSFPPFAWNNLPPLSPSPETRRWVQSKVIAYAKARKKEAANV